MVRLKHRYLLVNVLYPGSKDGSTAAQLKFGDGIPHTVQFRQPSSDWLDSKFLLKLIRDGVAELFGDYGSGVVAGSLQVKYLSSATSTAIVRVTRDHYRLVWAALTFTTHLPKPVDQACVIQVVRVSGTIKKAEEEAVRRARLSIKRAQHSFGKHGSKGIGLGAVDMANWANDELEDLGGFANGIEDPDEPGDEDEESD